MASDGDAPDSRRINEEVLAYTFAEINRLVQEHLNQQQQPTVPRPIHHRTVVTCDHLDAHQRLLDDYLAEQPWFGETFFRRRFRIHWPLFMSIVNALERQYKYFQFREDASGRSGHSPIQKCTAAIRQLADQHVSRVPSHRRDDCPRVFGEFLSGRHSHIWG